jgi:precorrin-2 dehydrogenase / sirohydrochlorin ferrochelatase
MAGYPIELELSGRPVLVVGLGAVGRRKALNLAAAGARVIGVDPNPVLIDGVDCRAEAYRAEHLRGMALVFAAATPTVNQQVVADAKAAGIWVNAADDPSGGDFTVPAVGRDGGVTLTVSTSGASPALAVALRDRALETLAPGAGGLAALFAELRPHVLARLAGVESSVRRRFLADWADPRWLDRFIADGPDVLRAAILRAVDLAGDSGRNLKNRDEKTERIEPNAG